MINPYRRLLFTLILSLLMLLNAATTFAKTTSIVPDPPQNPNSEQLFDAISANKTLDKLNLTITSDKISVKELQATIASLNKFQLQAKKCVDLNTALLGKFNQRLNEIALIAPTALQKKEPSFIGLTEEEKYLKNKKNEISAQLSECRLFSLRTEDLTDTIGKKLRELVATRLLYTHPSVLENLHNLPDKIQKSWPLKTDIFSDESGITFLINENPLLFLLSLLIIVLVFYTHKLIRKKLLPLISKKTATSFSTRTKQTAIAVLNSYLPLFSIAITLAIFFSIFTHSLQDPSYLALASYAFLGYVIFLFLIRFFFSPPPPAQGFTHLPQPVAEILTKRLNKLATLCLVVYVIYIFLHHQKFDRSLVDLFRTAVITLLSINLISIIWIIKKFPKLKDKPGNQRGILRFFISAILICLLFLILVAEYLGYHLLAIYVLNGIIMTAFLVFVIKFLNQIIDAALDTLKGTDQPWHKKLRSAFGLKRSQTFLEVLWLRALLYLTMWLAFLVVMLKIWGLAQANFQSFLGHLFYGFDIGKLHIVPSRILLGVLFFIILSLTTRWLRVYIIKNSDWRLEHSSKESLASIVGYIGFAFAFLLSALIIGVNFSGLALIAGALSVGIGFGLQNIVNNFVSGVILLIERPIKLGDRIVVGETEGYVKKISIRSTRLISTQFSDIIVPNSELVSQQVTNYMLYDMKYKIFTAVGIAYGSDTHVAKEVLLDIAKAHPEVITDDQELEPVVYFRTFGESSLNFELYCVIKDVNLKVNVISDLNFSIEKIFKEKGIEIAFPQRDIRITQWPKNAGLFQVSSTDR